MAECQEHFQYEDDLLDCLNLAISEARLATYLSEAGGSDRRMAVKLYLWNARIAKAFLYPLHVVEVTVRNAMHATFSAFFGGEEWMMPVGGNLYPRLTSESQRAIDKALGRLATKGNTAPRPGDIIAMLTFDFWSNLYRRDYRWLWQKPETVDGKTILEHVFPLAGTLLSRGSIKALVKRINDFRNRVAHHEPVYKGVNHTQLHDDILDLIAMRCASTAAWTRRHSTAMSVVRSRPTSSSFLPGRSLKTAMFVKPAILPPDETVSSAMAVVGRSRPPVALVPNPAAQPPFNAVTASLLTAFVAAKASELDGVVDLTDHTVADVVSSHPPVLLGEISQDATSGDAAAMFFRPGSKADKPQILIVWGAEGELVGVIAKPELRY